MSADYIPISEFHEDDLLKGLVWTWSTNPYESEDKLVPVPLTEEALASADSLMIRAEFSAKTGHVFNGFVVYHLGDDEIFSITLFVSDNSFSFNIYATDLSQEVLSRLALSLSVNPEDMLPLRYRIVPSELNIDDGEFTF